MKILMLCCGLSTFSVSDSPVSCGCCGTGHSLFGRVCTDCNLGCSSQSCWFSAPVELVNCPAQGNLSRTFWFDLPPAALPPLHF